MDEETRLRLLQRLETNPELSQRQLAKALGISVGKVNYCIKALIDKGWVKAGNFCRSPRKRGYLYQLTPAGVAAKATLTIHFLRMKEAEHQRLLAELEQLRQEARLLSGCDVGA